MYCEDDTKTTNKKLSDLDMVSNCHAGHPELPSSGLGTLKFLSEPKPRAVKEGSAVIVMGSVKVGSSPHWIQGAINDTYKLNKETEEDINETLGVTIEHPLMINNWGEKCSIRVPKIITIELDKVLTSVLASIETHEDARITEKPSMHKNYDMTEDSKTNEDPPIDGLELCFSPIDEVDKITKIDTICL